MTDPKHRQQLDRNVDRDEDQRGQDGGQPRSGQQGQMDAGEYGGSASGEGQGEFAGDGYSAQGQFSNQRVAQYGDQGSDQDSGRQGIGWQNRQDVGEGNDRIGNGPSESRGQSQRDETEVETSSP
jgi:hypothetical protein